MLKDVEQTKDISGAWRSFMVFGSLGAGYLEICGRAFCSQIKVQEYLNLNTLGIL